MVGWPEVAGVVEVLAGVGVTETTWLKLYEVPLIEICGRPPDVLDPIWTD